jgi:hypothetical protein
MAHSGAPPRFRTDAVRVLPRCRFVVFPIGYLIFELYLRLQVD